MDVDVDRTAWTDSPDSADRARLLQDSKSPAVMELQVRILASQLLPELPDLKICVAGRRVVEQHDPSRSNLRKPVLEVVADAVVGVQSVDVQQIHGAVSEILLRLVERRAQESGERPVVPLVVSVDLGEHGLVVMARMRIALPRVDRIALARHAVLVNRLAHPEVGLAVVRSELDHQRRPQAAIRSFTNGR